MIWGLRSAVWFGIALAALLLFLWCLLAMLEAEGMIGGYIWGLFVCGIVALVAGALAVVGQLSAGGVPRARDALTDTRSSPPPSDAAGRRLGNSGYRQTGLGDTPRASSGRPLV